MTISSTGKKITTAVKALGSTLAVFLITSPVFAAAPTELQAGATAAAPTGSSSDLPALFQMVSNTLIYIVGAVAVLFLIIGGLRYVMSNGDPKNVTAAKDTILYAIIGLIIAIIAYAVVNFVISKF